MKPLQGKKFRDIKIFGNSNITARHIAVPAVGLLMGGLFYIYARSSVNAAKRNAKLHRMADGGQFSWRNENQRRHGALERPAEKFRVKDIFGSEEQKDMSVKETRPVTTPGDEALKARKKKRKGEAG